MRSVMCDVRNAKCDMRISVFLLFFLCAAVSFAQAEGPPFVGRIKGDDVNVRSGPNKNFEALIQLDRDSLVFCKQERYGWYKIEAPENAVCYVSKEFVDRIEGGKAFSSVDRLNMRSRPSVDSSVLGQLKRNEEIKIAKELSNWYQIEPPEGCAAWVKAELVDFYSSADDYAKEAVMASTEAEVDKFDELDSPYAGGTIKKVHSIFKKARYGYKLVRDGSLICYLDGPKADFEAFRNMDVFVWGDVRGIKGKKTVLAVTKIKLSE